MDAISRYLQQHDLDQLCLTWRQSRLLVIRHLWKTRLLSIEKIRLFLQPIRAAPLYSLGYDRRYGDLVLDLTLGYTRGSCECQDYEDIHQILKRCVRLEVLNMKNCQDMPDQQFRELFKNNLQLCSSLMTLNIGYSDLDHFTLVAVFKLLPNIKNLCFRRIRSSNFALVNISKFIPNLGRLVISGYGAHDAVFQALAEGCPKLSYLHVLASYDLQGFYWVRLINARGRKEGMYSSDNVDDHFNHNSDYLLS